MKILCSELVYTSWKNGGVNSGFSVFSKSDDIEKSEVDEIIEKLAYVKPASLPNKPTEEEIATVFPKNNMYFRLESGRYCLAQSAYVGKDYAVDINPRWANYIIHAYVFDACDEIVPEGYIGSDVFKTSLTEEERQYKSGPVPAPREMEAALPDTEAKAALARIFATGSADNFFSFLQSLIARIDSDNSSVLVGLSDQNMIDTWMKAIPAVLPARYIPKVTYGTYLLFKNQGLKVNFIYNSAAFDYREEQKSFPQNAILFFEEGVLTEQLPLCDYLRSIKERAGVDVEKAMGIRRNIEIIWNHHPDITFAGCYDVLCYMTRDVAHFKNEKQFVDLTLRIISAPNPLKRASEVAFFMIKNCLFSEESKRKMLYIEDIFTRLESSEQGAVRIDFFRDCFMSAANGEEFLRRCEEKPWIKGRRSPVNYDFFSYFLDQGGELALKAEKFIMDIGLKNYESFDADLKQLYLEQKKKYCLDRIGMSKFREAAEGLKSLAQCAETEEPMLVPGMLADLINEKSPAFGDLDFCFAALSLVASNRTLYWSMFGFAYELARRQEASKRTFAMRYQRYLNEGVRAGEPRDADKAEYAEAYGFADLEIYSIFVGFTSRAERSSADYAEFYSKYLGVGGTLEDEEDAQDEFYEMLTSYVRSRKLKIELDKVEKKKRPEATYDLNFTVFDEMLPLIPREMVSERFFDWLINTAILPYSLYDLLYAKTSGDIFLAVAAWPGAGDLRERCPKMEILVNTWRILRDTFEDWSEEFVIEWMKGVREEERKTLVTFISYALIKNPKITKEYLQTYLTPFFNHYDLISCVIDQFKYSMSNQSLEVFAWLTDRYDEMINDAMRDHYEKNVMFPILTEHRKPLATMIEELGGLDAERYRGVSEYWKCISFVGFGKKPRRENKK